MSRWTGIYPEIEKKLKTELDVKLYELLCEGWQIKGTLWTKSELKKVIDTERKGNTLNEGNNNGQSTTKN